MAKKMLIVYYSISNGNTRRVAKQLQKATGADLAEIETVVPYTGTYDEIVDQGQQEVNRGYKPELKPLPVDPEEYDIIAVGTPTWWYTMAPAMLTFLTSHHWQGKTVIPFQTHGGWPGHVMKDIQAACAGADFVHQMAVQFDSTGGDKMITSEEEVENWVNQVKRKVDKT